MTAPWIQRCFFLIITTITTTAGTRDCVDARQISTEAILCVSACVLFFFSSSFFYEDIERSDRRQLFGDSLFSLSLSLSSTLFHQVRSSRKGRCPTPERQFRKGNGLNGRTWATAASHPVISLKKTSRGKCDFPAQNAHIIHPACAQYPQLSA